MENKTPTGWKLAGCVCVSLSLYTYVVVDVDLVDLNWLTTTIYVAYVCMCGGAG